MLDTLKRPLRDLRVSVTDRCNFRCIYCMPREVFGPDFAFLPHEQILTFEEIARLTRIFVNLGVDKIRLTGGEPLVRRDLHRLVGMLAPLEGLHDLALTTNGSLLPVHAAKLAAAGLKRVTVSLDALDDPTFMAMNDSGVPVARVLQGIEAAKAAGMGPIKVNAVIKRGVNEHAVLDLARHFRGTGYVIRFIEFMDVGNSNGWRMDDVVTAGEIVRRIHAEWPLEAVPPARPGEVASRYRYLDGQGEIGVIASVTIPFCQACNRARLSADGKLFTCLFATEGHDLRARMRAGSSDEEITAFIRQVWEGRGDHYSEVRSSHTAGRRKRKKIEMSYIGG